MHEWQSYNKDAMVAQTVRSFNAVPMDCMNFHISVDLMLVFCWACAWPLESGSSTNDISKRATSKNVKINGGIFLYVRKMVCSLYYKSWGTDMLQSLQGLWLLQELRVSHIADIVVSSCFMVAWFGAGIICSEDWRLAELSGWEKQIRV